MWHEFPNHTSQTAFRRQPSPFFFTCIEEKIASPKPGVSQIYTSHQTGTPSIQLWVLNSLFVENLSDFLILFIFQEGRSKQQLTAHLAKSNSSQTKGEKSICTFCHESSKCLARKLTGTAMQSSKSASLLLKTSGFVISSSHVVIE